MSKINLSFNNNNYSIDESALASATAELKTHLSSVMNGSGATISFDGVSYNVDSTKLSSATRDFISHLGTISGSGSKVKVNGIEYNVNSNKLSNAMSALQNTFDGLQSGSSDKLAAGLYQNGVMTKSWDELISEGIISVEDGCVRSGWSGDVEGLLEDVDNSINTSAEFLIGDLIAPDDVTHIGDGAFIKCTGLTTINFPKVTRMGSLAFYGCTSLTEATFPSWETSNSYGAFMNCTSLKTFNGIVKRGLDDACFTGCTSLTNVNTPALEVIYQYAFDGCTSLTVLDFPLLRQVWGWACCDCVNLKTFTIRNGYNNAFFDISAFINTKILTSEGAPTGEGFIYVPTEHYESCVSLTANQALNLANDFGMPMDEATAEYIARAILRKLEDYTVDGTITGALDESKI